MSATWEMAIIAFGPFVAAGVYARLDEKWPWLAARIAKHAVPIYLICMAVYAVFRAGYIIECGSACD
jgi:hypothetical protein